MAYIRVWDGDGDKVNLKKNDDIQMGGREEFCSVHTNLHPRAQILKQLIYRPLDIVELILPSYEVGRGIQVSPYPPVVGSGLYYIWAGGRVGPYKHCFSVSC